MTLMMGALQGLEGWSMDYNLWVGTRPGFGTRNCSAVAVQSLVKSQTSHFIHRPF